MAERELEVERKFTVPAGFHPDFAGVVKVGAPVVHTLDAVYHDTLACTLADAGWSLRRRTGGEDAGWHLKRPATGDGRMEVRAPDAPTIPDELRQEVREVTGLAALVPVARLRTRRQQWTLTAPDGTHVAIWALDDVRAESRAGQLAWTETEIELLPAGRGDLLDRLSERFVAAGAEPAPHASKVARALASVPRLAPPTRPDAPASDVLLTWAARQVGALQSLEPGVRADAVDHVHKQRVATRRLRSLLKTFARQFDTERTEPLRAELRWLGAALGEPRDAEVLREEFGELLAEQRSDVPPEIRDEILDHLAVEHRAAHARLVAALDSPRAEALRRALVEFLADPPFRRRAGKPAEKVLLRDRRHAIRDVAKLRKRAESAPEDLERWHEVRKAAKAVRYASEALAAAIPGVDEDVKLWENVTETLGELQDTAVAQALIVRVSERSGASPDVGVWRVLTQAQDRRRTASLADARQALDEASRTQA